MALKDYKSFFLLGLVFGIAVGLFYFYKQYNAPLEQLKQQNETILDLEQEIEDLKQNQTGVGEKEEGKVNLLTVLLIILSVGMGGYILYTKFGKGMGEVKSRAEIIEYMRQYSKDKDGIELFKEVKYTEGYYKADHEFPVALILFTRMQHWIWDTEPPAAYTYGYLVDRRDLDNVLEDFQGMSVKEVINAIKDTTWGMRTPHYKPYKTKSYEEEALKQFSAREETIKEAVEFRKAVEDRS